MQYESARLFLYFPAANQCLMCDTVLSLSFRDVFRMLANSLPDEIKTQYRLREDARVYEYTENRPCDTEISLLAAGVRTGMSFLIY